MRPDKTGLLNTFNVNTFNVTENQSFFGRGQFGQLSDGWIETSGLG